MNRLEYGTDHEFLVDALLSQFHVREPVEKRLLVPNLPQPYGRRRRDATGRLQIIQISLAEIGSIYPQRAGIERAALPAERLLRIELQIQRGQPVTRGAALHPASHVAQHLVGGLQADTDPVPAERSPQAANIPEQIAPRPKVGHEPGLALRSPRTGRRHRCLRPACLRDCRNQQHRHGGPECTLSIAAGRHAGLPVCRAYLAHGCECE